MPNETDKLRPFVKWAGGKRAQLDRIIPEIMSGEPKLYIEPFVGGGAVALALPDHIPKWISDSNHVLMDIWMFMSRNPDLLISTLHDCEREYGNGLDGYLAAKDQFNAMVHSSSHYVTRAALALYINARCFNGLWRTAGNGLFNVPFGKRKSPSSLTLDQGRAYAAALRTTKVFSQDFRDVFGYLIRQRPKILSGVVVYADPPYDGTFSGYGPDGFGEDTQRELATWLEALPKRGAKIVATNADTPLIHEIYSWAKISPLTENHVIGSTGARRGRRSCLLITSL